MEAWLSPSDRLRISSPFLKYSTAIRSGSVVVTSTDPDLVRGSGVETLTFEYDRVAYLGEVRLQGGNQLGSGGCGTEPGGRDRDDDESD